MLGLTVEGYKAKYGVNMDISERHLAWFAATPLPAVSDYPEGEYPYDASQAGEGSRACIAYDNLPVKGYVYAREEIMAIHDLDTRIPTAGGEAAICPDCGYVLEIPAP